MPIVSFVGLPGCGKSTIGRHVARAFDVRFIDSDAEIEKRIGGSIREFFEREGEGRFRDIEEAVIAELCSDADSVLATGGGSVLRAGNRAILRSASTVVYLSADPTAVFQRLRNDRHRPLLQVPDPLQKVRELHAERDPLYRETAHLVIETGAPATRALVATVMSELERAGRTVPARRTDGDASVVQRP